MRQPVLEFQRSIQICNHISASVFGKQASRPFPVRLALASRKMGQRASNWEPLGHWVMIIGCRPPVLFASYFLLASLAVDKRKQDGSVEAGYRFCCRFRLSDSQRSTLLHRQAKYPTAASSNDCVLYNDSRNPNQTIHVPFMLSVIYSFCSSNLVCRVLDPFIILGRGDKLVHFGPGINSSVCGW